MLSNPALLGRLKSKEPSPPACRSISSYKPCTCLSHFYAICFVTVTSSPGWPQTGDREKNNLELFTLLSPTPKCWNSRHAPPTTTPVLCLREDLTQVFACYVSLLLTELHKCFIFVVFVCLFFWFCLFGFGNLGA